MPTSRNPQRQQAPSRIQRSLQLAQQGSREALGEMLEGCRHYLLLIANEKLDPALAAKTGASDIVQDTFVSAGRYFTAFRGTTEEELLAWLRQILLNHLVAARRRFVQSQKRRVSREVSLGGSAGREINGDVADTGSETPSQYALINERARELQRALESLPACYRRVIQLRHREQLPFDEVARQLDLSPPAARQLWARAIKELQRLL